jgi:preprotein translocase subunit SecD
MLLGILGGNLFSPAEWHNSFRVNLGLDLSSGTQVTMKASTLSGGLPTSSEMSSAVTIITNRVNGTGNSGAQVQPMGSQDLVVSLPGNTNQQTETLVSTTALLMFRQVLLYEPYGTTSTPSPSPTPTPSASATSSAKATSTASASSTAKPSATPSASATSTAKTTAKIVPDATAGSTPTPTASSTASAHPTASASAHATASPSATPSPSSSSSPVSSAAGDASLVNKQTQALFNKLVCKPNESPQTWKQQIGYTTKEYDNPGQQIVACDSSGNKYALDVAKVQGTQVTGATADLSTTNNEWEVTVNFDGSGSTDFGNLTTNLYNKYYADVDTNQDDAVLDEVAIVLDGTVVSNPQIDAPITAGSAVINGSSFTQAYADQLQSELAYGHLPLSFTIVDVSSVSAQLGHAQLDGGLIAAGIGLLLVVIYSFIYYRGLSMVSISSLSIATVLGYLAIVLLCKYEKFTLDLTGIAGLIVAIGITADSFVVFFERLRDEVRDGKQLRPAVEAGWKRARRTILVSDTVTFLAALLLYYFSIGDVKGFAYTLGLTTLIDVFVVFTFTKPLVTIVAGTKFFGGGHRWSGLDPARLGAKGGWRSSVRRSPSRTRTATSTRTTGEA